MLQRKGGISSSRWNSPFLKQFQLLAWGIGLLRLCAKEQLDVTKLFVCDAHDANLAKLRQNCFHPFSMHLCILHTGTMADVNGELEHGEAVLHETLSKLGVFTKVFLRFCRQVEQYHEPHNPVFAKPFCYHVTSLDRQSFATLHCSIYIERLSFELWQPSADSACHQSQHRGLEWIRVRL